MGIRVSEASVTRPANTTAYAAGDVVGPAVGAAMEFFAEQSGLIRSAVLVDSAAEATKPDLDLALFTEAPDVAADNAAFAPTDAQAEKCVGVLSFLGLDFKTLAAGNGVIQADAIDIEYSADRKLYGVLIARNAYTPVSGEKFTVRLNLIVE